MVTRRKGRSSGTQVYLVPGFFGFTELGAFNYFHRVSETLGAALRERGVDAEIIETDTLPTGSIRRRASQLIGFVREHGGLERENIHFVGHSTGGLDVRMLLTPGVRLLRGQEEVEIAARTRSAITLSAPHHGTPLANFFTSLNGRNLLYLLTLLASSGPGRYSVYASSRLVAGLARVDNLFGQRDTLLDSLAENLLRRIQPDRGDALWRFVQEIARDQGAMVQLTPEAMDLFNAAVLDHDGTRYISFLSAAPPPRLRNLLSRPGDLYQPFTHAIYAVSHTITAREHRQYAYPEPDAEVARALREALPYPVDARTNDGIVPTLSQLWGEWGGVVEGDHLDVVGQFQHRRGGKAYTTWLYSGSGFDEARFTSLWADIAAAIAQAQG